jgi:hypothetical protein
MASEDTDEAAVRTKRNRAAHRGSVTRLLGQVDETVASADVCRLKQLKQSLNGKLDVLSKLDDDLIELVDEEHLDAEVEQADLIKENISLAVISIETTLGTLEAPPIISHKRRVREEPSRSQSPDSGDGEEHIATPTTTPEAATVARTTDTPHMTASHESSTSTPATPTTGTRPLVTDTSLPLVPRISLPTASSLMTAPLT